MNKQHIFRRIPLKKPERGGQRKAKYGQGEDLQKEKKILPGIKLSRAEKGSSKC